LSGEHGRLRGQTATLFRDCRKALGDRFIFEKRGKEGGCISVIVNVENIIQGIRKWGMAVMARTQGRKGRRV